MMVKEEVSSGLYRIGIVGLRVIRQIKRDKRSIVIIIVNPIIMMVLLGYALAGTLSGINLGVVELGSGPVQEGVLEHLESSDTFSLTHVASESDANRLITERQLDGAVVLGDNEIRLLLDGTNYQVASTITAQVAAGMQGGITQILESLPSNTAGQPRLPSVSTYYVYGYDLEVKDFAGPAMLGISVFFFTFMTTAISFLRERLQGTLEKVMTSPLTKVELVAGYIVGFMIVAAFQSITVFIILVLGFKVPMQGSLLAALTVIMLIGAGSLSFGAFLSNFARSEFQVMQYTPLVITPQIVLSGVFLPLQSTPEWLRPVAYIFPLTYSNDALRLILLKGATLGDVLFPDIFALVLFFVLTFTLAVRMLQREVG